MKSLEARIAALEQEDAPPPPFRRDLNEVERAVRIVHVLTHPESPQHAGLVSLLSKQPTSIPASPPPPASPLASSTDLPWRD